MYTNGNCVVLGSMYSQVVTYMPRVESLKRQTSDSYSTPLVTSSHDILVVVTGTVFKKEFLVKVIN